jgi:hypothetical protein
MTLALQDPPSRSPLAASRSETASLPLGRLPELMAFEASYLHDKLLRLKIVRTREEGTALFQEVKKYLVLGELHKSHEIPMFSRRVDEVWHQFVLFTHQYHEFSMRFFGDFVHHVPRESPSLGDGGTGRPKRSLAEFREIYEPIFGPLSELWYDERSLKPASRVTRLPFGKPMEVRAAGAKAELVLMRDPPVVLCRVDARAAAALEFVLRYDIFYLRELPGLSDPDRVALATTLMGLKVLSVAP